MEEIRFFSVEIDFVFCVLVSSGDGDFFRMVVWEDVRGGEGVRKG